MLREQFAKLMRGTFVDDANGVEFGHHARNGAGLPCPSLEQVEGLVMSMKIGQPSGPGLLPPELFRAAPKTLAKVI